MELGQRLRRAVAPRRRRCPVRSWAHRPSAAHSRRGTRRGSSPRRKRARGRVIAANPGASSAESRWPRPAPRTDLVRAESHHRETPYRPGCESIMTLCLRIDDGSAMASCGLGESHKSAPVVGALSLGHQSSHQRARGSLPVRYTGSHGAANLACPREQAVSGCRRTIRESQRFR